MLLLHDEKNRLNRGQRLWPGSHPAASCSECPRAEPLPFPPPPHNLRVVSFVTLSRVMSPRDIFCLCFHFEECPARSTRPPNRELERGPRVSRKAEVTQPRLFTFQRQFPQHVTTTAYLAPRLSGSPVETSDQHPRLAKSAPKTPVSRKAFLG